MWGSTDSTHAPLLGARMAVPATVWHSFTVSFFWLYNQKIEMIVNLRIVLCKVMCAYVLGQILRAYYQYILKQVIFKRLTLL